MLKQKKFVHAELFKKTLKFGIFLTLKYLAKLAKNPKNFDLTEVRSQF
jgi:hypothetical protein